MVYENICFCKMWSLYYFLIMARYFVFEGIVCMVSITIRGRYVGAISFCVCMQCQVWPAGVAVM